MADGILDGISNAVGGVGDFFLNRGRYADPNAMNAQFGVPEQDVRQAGINTLANVSALLLAAGQPMSGSERAKLLAGIGPALGGMQTDIFKASQARLMTAQQRTAMEEARGLASLGERMKTDPEGVGRLIGRDADFVRANTPTNIMKIMQSIGTRDPMQQQLAEIQLRQAKAAEAAAPAIRTMLEQDPVYGKPEMAAAREMILTNKSLQDDFLKSKTQRPSAQFEPATVIGADNKPILGQRNIVTGEFKPFSQGGVQIMPGERAEEAEVGKASAQRQNATIEAGAKAPTEIAKLNLADRIVGNIATGRWSDVKANIVSGARALGISDDTLKSIAGLDPNLPAARQQLTSIFNSVTVGLIGPGGFPANNFSDADRKFLTDIFPSITDEPEAIKVKLEVLRRVEKQKADKSSEWRAYQKRERDAGRRPNFTEFEQDYIDKQNQLARDGKDLFSDLVPRIPSAATGGARPAAPLSGTAGGLNWRVEQ
jgi:hypothetical protein